MLNKKFYDGYEGEGAIKVWSNENGVERGLIIWIGFFNTILEGCFNSNFNKNGIIECYYNQDGFYDDKWEMKYPEIVVEELKNYNDKNLDIRDDEIIRVSREVIKDLISFINLAIKREEVIYIEYE